MRRDATLRGSPTTVPKKSGNDLETGTREKSPTKVLIVGVLSKYSMTIRFRPEVKLCIKSLT